MLVDVRQFISLMLSITAFPPSIHGGENLWLNPQVFEFGKPMTLTCEVTDKTKAVTMWMTKSDGGPKMIADQFKLNFERANHSHSCVCECFDVHEGNGFRKYSRKVLVVESRCSKVKRQETKTENSLELIDCIYRHVNFLDLDLHLECNGKIKVFSNRTSTNGMIELRAIHRLHDDFEKCSLGFEDSKLSLNHGSNLADHLDGLIHEVDCHRDCSSNVQKLPIFCFGFFSGLGLIATSAILSKITKILKSRESQELILDLREDYEICS